MQIVIDIPDWVIDKDEYANYLGCMGEKLYEIIKNGTVLPKYGRIGKYNDEFYYCGKCGCGGKNWNLYNHCPICGVSKEWVVNE